MVFISGTKKMFKIGDKVRILSKEEIIKKCGGVNGFNDCRYKEDGVFFNSDMFAFCKKEFEIIHKKRWDDGTSYTLKGIPWNWRSWMFETKQLELF